MHAYSCGVRTVDADELPLKVVVEAHHTELGGMFITKCDTGTDLAYVEGVCVACNEVCTDCVLEEHQPVCKSCVDKAVLLDGECMCEIGRFFDPQTGACERCSEGCNTCINAQECIYCQVPLFVSDGQGGCQDSTCKDGKYFNQEKLKCKKCHESCETCQEADKCLTCPKDLYLYRDLCSIYCAFDCLNCNSSDQQCSQCGVNSQLIDGQCLCLPGTYSTDASCELCDFECESCSMTGRCDSCRDQHAELDPEGSCQCKSGYFLDEMDLTCQRCDEDCATCSKPGSCDTCPDGFQKGERRCLPCTESQYVTGDSCADCRDKFDFCNSCNDAQCLTFEPDFELSDKGKCICKAGYLLDQRTQKCEYICGDQNCIECENYRTCTRCRDGVDLIDGKCLEACDAGFFRDKDYPSRGCYECDNNCKTCSLQANRCTSCAQTDHFLNLDNVCEQCHESCATCTNQNTCLTCREGFEKAETICLRCDSNQFMDKDKCESCGPNCLQCTDGPKNCLQCAEFTFLNDLGTCECEKGFYFDSESQACKCESGTFFDKGMNSCSQCSVFCVECDDRQTCRKCEEGLNLVDGYCTLQTCPDGQFRDVSLPLQDQISCRECDASCATCIDSPFNCASCHSEATLCPNCPEGRKCVSCQGNTILNLDQGLCECPPATLLNATTLMCDPIPILPCLVDNCSMCPDRSICTGCQTGFYLQDGLCLLESRTESVGQSWHQIIFILVGSIVLIFVFWLFCVCITRLRGSKHSLQTPKKENRIETETLPTDGRVMHDTDSNREGSSIQNLIQSATLSENQQRENLEIIREVSSSSMSIQRSPTPGKDVEERKLTKFQTRKSKFKRMFDTEQDDSDEGPELKEGQSTNAIHSQLSTEQHILQRDRMQMVDEERPFQTLSNNTESPYKQDLKELTAGQNTNRYNGMIESALKIIESHGIKKTSDLLLELESIKAKSVSESEFVEHVLQLVLEKMEQKHSGFREKEKVASFLPPIGMQNGQMSIQVSETSSESNEAEEIVSTKKHKNRSSLISWKRTQLTQGMNTLASGQGSIDESNADFQTLQFGRSQENIEVAPQSRNKRHQRSPLKNEMNLNLYENSYQLKNVGDTGDQSSSCLNTDNYRPSQRQNHNTKPLALPTKDISGKIEQSSRPSRTGSKQNTLLHVKHKANQRNNKFSEYDMNYYAPNESKNNRRQSSASAQQFPRHNIPPLYFSALHSSAQRRNESRGSSESFSKQYMSQAIDSYRKSRDSGSKSAQNTSVEARPVKRVDKNSASSQMQAAQNRLSQRNSTIEPTSIKYTNSIRVERKNKMDAVIGQMSIEECKGLSSRSAHDKTM